MREIVLDTETTGLDPAQGHRIVEIGCVELENYVPTGRTFWRYVNPERSMPTDAEAVHGITEAFLKDKPVFRDVAFEFVEFIGDAPLVIHNASFDLKFLNFELSQLGYPEIPAARAIDTVLMARKKFPGSPANLDALCKRFAIDLSERNLHGALLDSRLLAAVYLELRGGRQQGLAITSAAEQRAGASIIRTPREPRPHAATAEELAAHATFVEKIPNALWKTIRD